MADNSSDQEKTEQPSAKRLQDAKKKGQVPRSRELNVSLATLGGGVLLIFSLQEIHTAIQNIFHTSFSISTRSMLSDAHLMKVIGEAFPEALSSLSFLFFMLIVIILLGPTLIGGWSFSTETFKVKFSKLNPAKGLKRMFGVNGLVELVKSLLKVILIASIAYAFFYIQHEDFLSLSSESYDRAIAHAVQLVLSSFLFIAAGLILILGIDVPYQIWNHHKQLRMSIQELKDEFKETEGNPESKSRVRNMQREVAQRKMLQEVPTADVVIVNPTHFSVALRYDTEKDAAPILVAKGADYLALKIREIANEHKVPVFTAPLLARAIYHTTDLENEVPSALYVAVAKVLAYVFQVKSAKPGQYPKPPSELLIPKEYQGY